MYVYHGSSLQKERVKHEIDHCGSEGPVYPLADLIVLRGRRMVVLDPENRRKALTAIGNLDARNRVLIYAVNAELELRVALDGRRGAPGAVKHETLFHNGDVLAAGEMGVLRGIIVEVNDRSGSYGTHGDLELTGNTLFAAAVVGAMRKIDVPFFPLAASEWERLARLAGL
jgi:hypothetical protein